jgi:hypothetical protein
MYNINQVLRMTKLIKVKFGDWGKYKWLASMAF